MCVQCVFKYIYVHTDVHILKAGRRKSWRSVKRSGSQLCGGQPGSVFGQLKHVRAQKALTDDSFMLFAVLVA